MVVVPAEGTLLKMTISGTPTAIGQVTEFDGPEILIAAVETTHLASSLHTRRPSKVPDPQKLTGKIELDPNDTAMHKLLHDRVGTPSTNVGDTFTIEFNTGDTTKPKSVFTGFWTKFAITGVKVEENLMADFEVQLTSVPVLTVGTP